jgi:hypothetical protein
METSTVAMLLAMVAIGLTIVGVILMSSQQTKDVWVPQEVPETTKTMVSPRTLVEEASTWYAAAKQEEDFLEAFVRASYGIACLQSIQNTMQLVEVKDASLPSTIRGPDDLKNRLVELQNALAKHLRANRTPMMDPLENALKDAVAISKLPFLEPANQDLVRSQISPTLPAKKLDNQVFGAPRFVSRFPEKNLREQLLKQNNE